MDFRFDGGFHGLCRYRPLRYGPLVNRMMLTLSDPLIQTPRLALRLPPPTAAPVLLAYLQGNLDHFRSSSPPPPESGLDLAFCGDSLAAARTEFALGSALRLVLFHRDRLEGPVVGHCGFSNIVRGVLQGCHLGYALDRDHVGQGLMEEALRAAIGYVFGELRLHRIIAHYMPANVRSARLLERLGFVIEGRAREYLYLDGAWQDHVQAALVNRQEPRADLSGPSDTSVETHWSVEIDRRARRAAQAGSH